MAMWTVAAISIAGKFYFAILVLVFSYTKAGLRRCHGKTVSVAATTRFLAVVPTSMLRFSAKDASIKLLPVELPMTHWQIGIVTLKNRTLSSLAQLFIKCAREVARPLAKKNP